jgi:hypothetical protein
MVQVGEYWPASGSPPWQEPIAHRIKPMDLPKASQNRHKGHGHQGHDPAAPASAAQISRLREPTVLGLRKFGLAAKALLAGEDLSDDGPLPVVQGSLCGRRGGVALRSLRCCAGARQGWHALIALALSKPLHTKNDTAARSSEVAFAALFNVSSSMCVWAAREGTSSAAASAAASAKNAASCVPISLSRLNLHPPPHRHPPTHVHRPIMLGLKK